MITDGQGYATTTFLKTTPDEWAVDQLKERYGHVLTSTDPTGSPPRLAYDQLKDERKALGSWFDESGKLSPLLQSAFLTNRFHGPIGNGFGWDFRPSGEPEGRMLLFKGALIAATRAALVVPEDQRSRGSIHLGGIATMVRGAYTERAALHTWKGDVQSKLDGAELSRRWVSFQTFSFLARLNADYEWAWDVSKCRKVFGPVDESTRWKLD
jgi:hypothetical protein